MEESSEIKVETDTSKTSWIRSSMAASGKRISKAFSYITGEMKECGEGLKGRGPVRAAPDPLERSHPIVPQETPEFSADQTEFCFNGLSKIGVLLLRQTYSLLGCKYDTCKCVGSRF